MNYIIKQIKSQYLFSLFLLLGLTIFFPFRKVFFTSDSYILGEYSDFTTISLYLSDIILLILLLFSIFPRGISILLKTKPNYEGFLSNLAQALKQNSYYFLIFWLILDTFLHLGHPRGFSIHLFLRLTLLLIVTYGTIKNYVSHATLNIKALLKFYVFLSTIQAFIGIFQFISQKSVGLYLVGEPHLSSVLYGVAKLALPGGVYIRAYGTFPHPNVFGAFLVVSLLVCAYFIVQCQNFKHKLLYIWLFFINSTAFILTFSRAAFLAFLVSFTSFLVLLWLKDGIMKKASELLLVAGLTFLTLGLIFYPFLLNRATISDQASLQRKEYVNIGLKMVNSNPILGQGIGNSVLHMEQFSPKPMNLWEKQPIHNYFLLTATELGIPGFSFVLLLFFSSVKKLVSILKKKDNQESILLLSILLAFFVLMQFDHYFYTLNQAQLLLWLTLGFVWAIKNPQIGDS